VQLAGSSSISSGRLPSKPETNPREHCNCFVLRSGKQLKGSKGARVKEDDKKNHAESDKALSCEDELQEKNKVDKSKEPTPPSLKPFKPPLPFP